MNRSWLFAPGHNEKLLGKVFDAGADAVILDLEDAVAPEHKADSESRVGGRRSLGSRPGTRQATDLCDRKRKGCRERTRHRRRAGSTSRLAGRSAEGPLICPSRSAPAKSCGWPKHFRRTPGSRNLGSSPYTSPLTRVRATRQPRGRRPASSEASRSDRRRRPLWFPLGCAQAPTGDRARSCRVWL